MNKYMKPTLQVIATQPAGGATSSCSTGTQDAKEIIDILYSMGYNPDFAFGMAEATCTEKVTFDDYCKFSSGITVFYS